MLFDYANVAAFFLIAIVFVFGAMLVGRWIRPHRLYKQKLETYECGEVPVGQAWFNFNPRFYIIALVYLVFDIEIAFIYPVARVFQQWVAQGLGWFALVELLVFVAILLVGLAYVWRKHDLDWIRSIALVHQAEPSLASASAPTRSAADTLAAHTSDKADDKADQPARRTDQDSTC